jgi:hypothetical protein
MTPEELRESLEHAAGKGYYPRVEGEYLVFPGWGFNMYLKVVAAGTIVGFIDDTAD